MARPPHRFYFPSAVTGPGESIILPAGESHHMLRVLRMKEGARVRVLDKSGRVWLGEIASAAREGAKVAITELHEDPASADPRQSRLHVAVSVLKGRAMSWMIEKLCELDVASIQPLVCARTVAAPEDLKDGTYPARWDRIVSAAAKQSGRTAPMTFHPITPLAAWLERERPPMITCFAHAAPGAETLGPWLADRAGLGLPVLVAIGPEGGWTPDEIGAFDAKGFAPVGLGPLVLRAETAAITVAGAARVML